MAYISGSNGRKKSIADAVRCFYNGMKHGDNGAEYNYAFLIAKGCVDCPDDDILPILNDLVQKGLVSSYDTSFIIDGWNPLDKVKTTLGEKEEVPSNERPDLDEDQLASLRALNLRKMLEKKINEIIVSNSIPFEGTNLDEKISRLSSMGLIEKDVSNKYHKIRIACNKGGIHEGGDYKPIPENKFREYKKYIEKHRRIYYIRNYNY